MDTFENLGFWQKSHQLTLKIYEMTRNFPNEEKFGITSQLRRATSSVPANITEGYARKSKLEKARFFNIALSSLEEARYFLILSRDLKLINNFEDMNLQIVEIRKMIGSYTTMLKNSKV